MPTVRSTAQNSRPSQYGYACVCGMRRLRSIDYGNSLDERSAWSGYSRTRTAFGNMMLRIVDVPRNALKGGEFDGWFAMVRKRFDPATLSAHSTLGAKKEKNEGNPVVLVLSCFQAKDSHLKPSPP